MPFAKSEAAARRLENLVVRFFKNELAGIEGMKGIKAGMDQTQAVSHSRPRYPVGGTNQHLVIGLVQPEKPNTDAHGFPRMNTDAPRPIRPVDPGSRGRHGDALGSVLGRPRDPRGRATRPRGGRVRRPVAAKTWPETSSVCIRVYPWNIFRMPWVAAFECAAFSGVQGLLVWRRQADNWESICRIKAWVVVPANPRRTRRARPGTSKAKWRTSGTTPGHTS